MDERIDAEVQYSIDDYVRGSEFIRSRGISQIYSYLISFIPTFIGFIVVYWLLIRKSEDSLNFNDALALVFGLIIIIPISYLLKDFKPITGNYFAKQYESSPFLQELHIVSFNEEGIESKSNSIEGKIYWNTIIEATETDQDFFFFISPKAASFMPKNAFSEENRNQIRKLAERKLGDKTKFLQSARR